MPTADPREVDPTLTVDDVDGANDTAVAPPHEHRCQFYDGNPEGCEHPQMHLCKCGALYDYDGWLEPDTAKKAYCYVCGTKGGNRLLLCDEHANREREMIAEWQSRRATGAPPKDALVRVREAVALASTQGRSSVTYYAPDIQAALDQQDAEIAELTKSNEELLQDMNHATALGDGYRDELSRLRAENLSAGAANDELGDELKLAYGTNAALRAQVGNLQRTALDATDADYLLDDLNPALINLDGSIGAGIVAKLQEIKRLSEQP